MSRFPQPIQNLINGFTRFPGIGPKTATRFVFHLLSRPEEELKNLAQSIASLKAKITHCKVCQNFSLGSPCEICQDLKRNKSLVCVVSRPQDLEALEKTNEYPGVYHILGGTISPLQGIGPEHLKIQELINRVKKDNIQEIILALNPDMNGETTSLYLTKLLKPFNIKITRLARGLPVGSELEYADEVTLSSALKGRKEV